MRSVIAKYTVFKIYFGSIFNYLWQMKTYTTVTFMKLKDTLLGSDTLYFYY